MTEEKHDTPCLCRECSIIPKIQLSASAIIARKFDDEMMAGNGLWRRRAMSEQCGSCRFWLDYDRPDKDNSTFGECHVHAPIVAGDKGCVWPETGYANWCGDFEDDGCIAKTKSQ